MTTPSFDAESLERRSARPQLSFRGSCIIAFLVPILLLLPFVNKPFHADDHVFVWVAQQIAKDPLDFFGFDVDYGYAKVPIHEVNHNPPGVPYFLALLGAAGGWNEVPLHLGMLLFTGLAGLGIYLLARDLSPAPLPATFMAVLTPVFLVSASSLMTDVPLLACYVWSIYLWRRGLDADKGWYLAGAALLMGAAYLCKYYGVTLLPLLFTYSVLRKRSLGRWPLYFLIPAACIAGYEIITYVSYGITTFSDAAGVALASKWRSEETGATRWVLALVFTGGSFLPLVLYLRPLAAWRWLAAGAGVAALLALPLIEGFSPLQLLLGTTEPYTWPELLMFALLLFIGAAILAVSARELLRQRDADAALLALWIFGSVLFAAAINHYVSARTLLPIAPAIGIVLTRGLPVDTRCAMPKRWFRWRSFAAAALCLWIVAGDYEAAEHGKRAVREAAALARDEAAPLYHVAFWGFEYYVTEAGSTPFSFEPTENYGDAIIAQMPRGALLVVHSHGAETWKSPPGGFEDVARFSYPFHTRLITFHAVSDAGFYSHKIGYLPFRIGSQGPEEFLVLRWAEPPRGQEF